MAKHLTIGVPTYQSAKRLELFLPALQRQGAYRQLLNLIFVDNGSTDETLTILEAFKNEHGRDYASIQIESIPRVEPPDADFNLTKITNIVNARNQIIDLTPPEQDVQL